MDYCEQVSAQEEEDNFLMEKKPHVLLQKIFSVVDEILSDSLCYSVRPWGFEATKLWSERVTKIEKHFSLLYYYFRK